MNPNATDSGKTSTIAFAFFPLRCHRCAKELKISLICQLTSSPDSAISPVPCLRIYSTYLESIRFRETSVNLKTCLNVRYFYRGGNLCCRYIFRVLTGIQHIRITMRISKICTRWKKCIFLKYWRNITVIKNWPARRWVCHFLIFTAVCSSSNDLLRQRYSTLRSSIKCTAGQRHKNAFMTGIINQHQ
jgi:hypothetical protein